MEMIDIEYVPLSDQDMAAPPIVANFTNGHLQPSRSNELTFSCYESKQHQVQRRPKRILVAESDSVKYVGRNFGKNVSTATTNQRLLVGAYSESEGKVRLFDAQYFNMTPFWPDESLEDEKPDDQVTETSFREKAEKLTKEFGSAREKRLINARQRNKVKEEDLETSIGSAVDMVKDSVVDVPIDDQTDLLPVCNKSAAKPQDVYLLNDLISDGIMNALHTPAKLFVDSNSELIKEWKEKHMYPMYILNKLTVLPLDAAARCDRAACLTYLNYLFHLYQLKPADFRKRNYLPADIPSIVKDQILNNFTTVITNRSKQIRCISARLKDKIIFHILVLCLILDQFIVDYTVLLQDLKVSAKKLTMCFRAVGCHTSTHKTLLSDTPSLKATLKLPLKFPEVRPKKTKQKR